MSKTYICFSQAFGSYTSRIVVYHVTYGMTGCRVGVLPVAYNQMSQLLDGRLVQVTEVFDQSTSATKRRKSVEHGGIVLAIIIDTYLSQEGQINTLTDGYDTDSTVEILIE